MRLRLPLHGRDHRAGGADPIPGIGGFIRYDFENVGDWLLIETTGSDDLTSGRGVLFKTGAAGFAVDTGTDFGTDPDNGAVDFYTGGFSVFAGTNGFNVGTSPDGPIFMQTGGDGPITLQAANAMLLATDNGSIDLTSTVSINLDSDNQINLSADGIGFFTAVDQIEIRVTGTDAVLLLDTDDGDILIEPSGSGKVARVTVGGKTFEFRADGNLHIPTGGTVVADT